MLLRTPSSTTISALKLIFLDHNSTTMMEQGANSALLLSLSSYGNPSSVHAAGRKAKALVDEARDKLAAALGISDPDEILFTASATEATNTALKGLFQIAEAEGRGFQLITSAVEHEATLETAKYLAEQGATLEILSVDAEGRLDLSQLKTILQKQKKNFLTVLSLMAANNETGVIFPWLEAAKIAHEHGALFHLDAVQAPGKMMDFTLAQEAVDLASFSGHKIGALKGVGALYIRKGVRLVSLLHGGAQERKRRAGTLNVPGIVSFGAAAEALAKRDLLAVKAMRDSLEQQISVRIPGTKVQGAGTERLVNTSNFLFEAVRGESLLMGLDLDGFAVSSGSACNSGSILPSHVLLAMGLDKAAAASALRVSLGPNNTMEELNSFLGSLERIVGRIRQSSASADSLRT